ncbi:MAG: MarR family transcriptional regulator [Candidatus Sedimenticola sp. PURPLELP]
MQTHDQVLIALRQIIRAIDLHSKKLERESGLTGPQLLLMQIIQEEGPVTSSVLARSVSLSQATVTTILDRLEKKAYLTRERDSKDKRKVWISLSDAGKQVIESAPALLQDGFIKSFGQLKEWEQSLLLSSLQRIASMMQASDLEASPVLDSSEERLVKIEESK